MKFDPLLAARMLLKVTFRNCRRSRSVSEQGRAAAEPARLAPCSSGWQRCRWREGWC